MTNRNLEVAYRLSIGAKINDLYLVPCRLSTDPKIHGLARGHFTLNFQYYELARFESIFTYLVQSLFT